ncbi:hypothetical protein, conserved [Babesia bigemina]|uniref:Uncharacterized protein n=1 Tax=Babesia bigemina TaxID=5866 RepID=A0A061D1F0_BABBI|nr:hypothetical protein, conserved [Babesia bigemina]CDR93942.1 hypothetical protein, conserved [Babesia bigemina]|eukprot:XP_012766128.1 hypothetical protein, conserved [Babesia bigemina]
MASKNSPPVLVPSDVTICEGLYATGSRQLSFSERLGLLLTPNPIRFTFTKNGRTELQAVLTKSYGDNDDTITQILRARQESIIYNFAGTVGLSLLSLYSLRYHSIKTKVLVVPFAAYGGSLIGRAFGDAYVGRWSEYGRDRALGDLPSMRYLTESEIKSYTN